MAQGAFTLRIQPPDGAPSSVQLVRELLIGRDPICDVVLEHPTVSGNHVLLERKGSSVAIKDLDSTNGTIVDDSTIGSEVWVRENAVIRVGAFRLDLVAEIPVDKTKTAQIELRGAPLDDRDRTVIRALMADWTDPSVRLPAPRPATEMAETLHLSRQEVNRRVARLEAKLGMPRGTRGARRYHELKAELLRRGFPARPRLAATSLSRLSPSV